MIKNNEFLDDLDFLVGMWLGNADKAMCKAFGRDFIFNVKLTKTPVIKTEGAFAYYSLVDRDITMAKEYFLETETEQLVEIVNHTIDKAGFHPQVKNVVQYILVHEMSHAVWFWIIEHEKENLGDDLQATYEKWLEIEEHQKMYGATNIEEFFAEEVAEYICGGNIDEFNTACVELAKKYLVNYDPKKRAKKTAINIQKEKIAQKIKEAEEKVKEKEAANENK